MVYNKCVGLYGLAFFIYIKLKESEDINMRKKHRIRGSCIALIIIAAAIILCVQCRRGPECNLTIVYPSIEQGTIAPARDFYVIGDIDSTITVPDNAVLVVELKNNAGKVIRSVSTSIKDNKDGLNINYELLSYYGSDREELRNSCMPDLVYNPANPESFKDTWIKCYYNDQNYTALIYGGTYDKDINSYDQNGKKLKPLKEGTYCITVTLSEPGKNRPIATAVRKIRIKYADDKILSRFTPTQHFNNVLKEAKIHDYTIFLDPFPGFWNPHTFIDVLQDSDMFCEILPKWRLADSQEYIDGRVHFYIYNVSESSATYNVEVGQLAYDNALNDCSRVTYSYYDIGEPVLPNGNIKGTFKEFDRNKPISLTRVDYPTGSSEDNYVIINDLINMKSDTDLSDGINVKAGETVSFYGVCKPIPSDVTRDDSNKYTIDNRITHISYTYLFSDMPIEMLKPVTLTRVYPTTDFYAQLELKRAGIFNAENATVASSILEFKHDLVFPSELKGKQVQLKVSGMDKYSNIIGKDITIIVNVE